ncbi:MAG: SUMF1/EgtB/PvdO family nonheme iron enzyme [Bacteroidota bacterium]
MKAINILTSLIFVFSISCTAQEYVPIEEIKFISTGIDSEAWVKIPAGEFLKGQHRHETIIEKEYEIMVTDVTNAQYVQYLNDALAKGTIKVEADTVSGYYPGEPFDGYKHEFEISAGNKLYLNLVEPGIRIKYESETFSVIKGFENHPVTFVTWFGANAYAQFNGWRLPTENEWEKAARGTDERTFPWGEEISANVANYLSSHNLFEKIFSEQITTTPVGFFNGKTYDGYETIDNKSPYGLYDMAGNVWQWCGDDYPDVHYRYMRGGSRSNYEYNLFVWARNSAGPGFYSMYIGFRCARDVQVVEEAEVEEETK